jgi:hypothetical protein
MPNDYEQSPDYGGPPPTWRGIALGIVAVVAFATWLVLWG